MGISNTMSKLFFTEIHQICFQPRTCMTQQSPLMSSNVSKGFPSVASWLPVLEGGKERPRSGDDVTVWGALVQVEDLLFPQHQQAEKYGCHI